LGNRDKHVWKPEKKPCPHVGAEDRSVELAGLQHSLKRRALRRARRADPNTKNGHAAIQRNHAKHQPRLGAGAARGMNHMINVTAKFHRLTKQFLCSINIAK
jgi:hypothetical protein